MADRRGLGVALAVTSATSFGVMPVLTKVVYEDGADTTGVLSFRFTAASLVLLALARLHGERLPRGRALAAITALGAVGYALEATAYFEALERISAGLTALLLYLYPALVVVLSAVFLHHRPTRTAMACVAAATIGTALTVGPVAGGQAVGVLLGLAAAASYAVYIVVSSRVASGTGPLATSAVVMGGAAVTYDARALAGGAAYPSEAGAWAALVGVTLIGTVIAVATFFAALALLGPADTAVVSTVEPVVSVVTAVVFLDESLTGLQLVGGALVVAAVVVLARGDANARSRDSTPAPG